MTELLVYEGSSEWSALYVDGELDRVGDHYLITDRVLQLCDVAVIQSDDFLQGGNTREDCAKNLTELQAYTKKRLDIENQAKSLREQAAKLLEEAKKLEKHHES